MSKPLITIGVTCFNAQDTITRAIQSALDQTWESLEIIVVDDASNDQSVERVTKLAQTDNRITLIKHEKNKGYPSALNTIIKNAKGDYIAFFDDDDESMPDRITKQIERITKYRDKNPDAQIVCYSNRKVFVDHVERPDGFVYAIGRSTPEPVGAKVADNVLWHYRDSEAVWGEFGSCTLIAKTGLLKKHMFDSEFRRMAEWDFAIRLAFEEGHFIAVDEPLVHQHKTPTSDKAGRKPLDYSLKLRTKHKKYLKTQNTYWGACCLARARFFYARHKPLESRIYTILACCLSLKIFLNQIRLYKSR